MACSYKDRSYRYCNTLHGPRNIMLSEKNQGLNSKKPEPVHLHEVQEQAKRIHGAKG